MAQFKLSLAALRRSLSPKKNSRDSLTEMPTERSFIGGVKCTGVPTDPWSVMQMRRLGKNEEDELRDILASGTLSHGCIHFTDGRCFRFGGHQEPCPPSLALPTIRRASIRRSPTVRSHTASVHYFTDEYSDLNDSVLEVRSINSDQNLAHSIASVDLSDSAEHPDEDFNTAPPELRKLIVAANDVDETAAATRFAALLAVAEDLIAAEQSPLATESPLTTGNLHQHDQRCFYRTSHCEAWWR